MASSLVCVDAGLALELVLPEQDSDLAESLWDEWERSEQTVIAPSLWAYEVTSVIRNSAHRGRLSDEQEVDAFLVVHALPVELMRPAGLHRRAHELARRFDRPSAYDAHYLALAEMADCVFWTADRRLFNVVHAELDWVRWLGDHRPGESTR